MSILVELINIKNMEMVIYIFQKEKNILENLVVEIFMGRVFYMVKMIKFCMKENGVEVKEEINDINKIILGEI